MHKRMPVLFLPTPPVRRCPFVSTPPSATARLHPTAGFWTSSVCCREAWPPPCVPPPCCSSSAHPSRHPCSSSCSPSCCCTSRPSHCRFSQLSALLTGIHSARLASPPAALLAAISDSCALVLESAVASSAAAAGAVAGASDEQHPAAVGGDSLVVAQQAAVLPLLLQRLGCRVSQRVCGLVCSVTGPCLLALSGAELADLSLGLALAGHQPGQE